jgi:hypothetical protein
MIPNSPFLARGYFRFHYLYQKASADLARPGDLCAPTGGPCLPGIFSREKVTAKFTKLGRAAAIGHFGYGCSSTCLRRSGAIVESLACRYGLLWQA